MQQELQKLAPAAAEATDAVRAGGLATRTGKQDFSRPKRSGPQRRMVDHRLPPYVEANHRALAFMLVRAPNLKDFPREKVYRPESIDLLYRHFFRGQ
tara:strand:- start:941 stop:1231 length:291 start_codon:yes stop_codon:yes gene_type:complete